MIKALQRGKMSWGKETGQILPDKIQHMHSTY